jgi:hypothetical protein
VIGGEHGICLRAPIQLIQGVVARRVKATEPSCGGRRVPTALFATIAERMGVFMAKQRYSRNIEPEFEVEIDSTLDEEEEKAAAATPVEQPQAEQETTPEVQPLSPEAALEMLVTLGRTQGLRPRARSRLTIRSACT